MTDESQRLTSAVYGIRDSRHKQVIAYLVRWGEWAAVSGSGPRGYPSRSAFAPRSLGDDCKDFPQEVEAVDRAIAKLAPREKSVIKRVYLFSEQKPAISRDYGITVEALNAILISAYNGLIRELTLAHNFTFSEDFDIY